MSNPTSPEAHVVDLANSPPKIDIEEFTTTKDFSHLKGILIWDVTEPRISAVGGRHLEYAGFRATHVKPPALKAMVDDFNTIVYFMIQQVLKAMPASLERVRLFFTTPNTEPTMPLALYNRYPWIAEEALRCLGLMDDHGNSYSDKYLIHSDKENKSPVYAGFWLLSCMTDPVGDMSLETSDWRAWLDDPDNCALIEYDRLFAGMKHTLCYIDSLIACTRMFDLSPMMRPLIMETCDWKNYLNRGIYAYFLHNDDAMHEMLCMKDSAEYKKMLDAIADGAELDRQKISLLLEGDIVSSNLFNVLDAHCYQYDKECMISASLQFSHLCCEITLMARLAHYSLYGRCPGMEPTMKTLVHDTDFMQMLSHMDKLTEETSTFLYHTTFRAFADLLKACLKAFPIEEQEWLFPNPPAVQRSTSAQLTLADEKRPREEPEDPPPLELPGPAQRPPLAPKPKLARSATMSSVQN